MFRAAIAAGYFNIDPYPRHEPRTDNPHPGHTGVQEIPILPGTRDRRQADGPLWYFLGLPLGLEIFRGMSGAGAGPEAQEKYLSGPGRHIRTGVRGRHKRSVEFLPRAFQEPHFGGLDVTQDLPSLLPHLYQAIAEKAANEACGTRLPGRRWTSTPTKRVPAH